MPNSQKKHPSSLARQRHARDAEHTGVKCGNHVIDLDSGDGRLVILAVKRFEATGLGG